jgi:hypothetical protein
MVPQPSSSTPPYLLLEPFSSESGAVAASLCMISSHLFRGHSTGLPPPKQLPSTFFGIRCCSMLTTWPAHINLFKSTRVERATSLYTVQQNSSGQNILVPNRRWRRGDVGVQLATLFESFVIPLYVFVRMWLLSEFHLLQLRVPDICYAKIKISLPNLEKNVN